MDEYVCVCMRMCLCGGMFVYFIRGVYIFNLVCFVCEVFKVCFLLELVLIFVVVRFFVIY